LSSLKLWMKSMKVCTRNPYFESTKLINLSRVRIRRRIIVTKGRIMVQKHRAMRRIGSSLTLPKGTRKRNFRITMML
jgi:hypothetical protein